jgi:hypothetical protein
MCHAAPTLCTLPTELLLEICTHMPSSSRACLAFTCRHLYSKIPPYLFGDIKTRDLADYKDLLRYLHQDRPQITICDFCTSLHTPLSSEELPEEVDANDYFLMVHEPLESTPESRKAVLNVKQSYLKPVILRAGRAAGTLHNQGMCHSRFICRGKALLVFPVDDASEDGDDRDEDVDVRFSATVFWNTEPPHVTQGRRRMSPRLAHLTVYKIILSTTLLRETPYFEGTQAVLGKMGIRCCTHCPGGAVESEIICKLGQMLYTEEKGKCSCAHGQSEQTCLKHKHIGHEGKCSCSTHVEVKIVGGCGFEVNIWRYGRMLDSVEERRNRMRRRYKE